MKIVVQKFGGTSVSTEENRQQVINKVKNAIKEGYSPVLVVSAMGRKGQPYATDTLLSLIDDKFKNTNKLAKDLLMCCGEIISSVVMSDDLYNAGIDAVPLTGGQAGILTDNNFNEATCIDVKPKKIFDLVSQGRVPVVTGFQGVTENGYLTTLGRGGSDTTASILGVALKAEAIEIYTDVDGIMTADPRVVENANLIDVISYYEVFQLAEKGATVIHPKAVEVAMEGNIPILIKNTMSDCKGTLINNFGDKSNDRMMTGITSQKNRIQVSITAAENQGNSKYKNVLDLLAANKISLDLINIFPSEQIFTVNQADKETLENVLNSANLKYILIENCSKVAVIGSKMKGIPGVMAKIIKALSDNNIEVLQTADSHMTIWCLVHSKDEKEAINVLHKTFKL
ncbi:aspartate kinase [Clostridium chromiireducens]|uniref:Aspartokinase n=1 Tax=Clostridium chromiireducens TaxID=225345 RepID=A0A1V4IZZ6_9CLOT|nr:aspartate kinase [Clostridium chromiireducens]OPJ65473.1 aspartokinase [Clostridium chromiireducens]RII35170.1 aspartate kinase [Clostridium chromiireducens]